MIKLKNVSYKTENKTILNNINIEFSQGEIVAITGPNGSGKSTLVKIIMGIVNQTSGDIFLNGQNINQLTIDKRANLGIGFAFQQPIKFKGITTEDLLTVAVGKQNLNGACEILSQVGLCAKDYLKRQLDGKLSGGELKRIELAINLAQDKPINIYDEPEAGIDMWSFDRLVKIFKTRKTQNSLTIIVTHNKNLLKTADKILILQNGEIKHFGESKDILPLIENSTCKKLSGGEANE